MHDRVDVLLLHDEAHEVCALDVALDELRSDEHDQSAPGLEDGGTLAGNRGRTLKLGLSLTAFKLFRDAQ